MKSKMKLTDTKMNQSESCPKTIEATSWSTFNLCTKPRDSKVAKDFMQVSQPIKQHEDKTLQQSEAVLQDMVAVPKIENSTSPSFDSSLSKDSDPQLFTQNPPTVKEQLLAAEGGYYTSNEAAKLLDISEKELQKWRETEKLIGLPLRNGTFVYPKWQFSENAILLDLDKVLAQFPYKSPWGRAAFMLDTWISNDLGTPLAGLKAGKLSEVLALVNGIGEQGAL
jgi:hypothetical protein